MRAKKVLSCLILIGAVLLFTQLGTAQETTETETESLLGLSIEELLDLDLSDEQEQGITVYGYMSTNIEKVFQELSVEEGVTTRTDAPHEWSLPHFNLFLRAPLSKNIKTFVNLASEGLEVRNMWGNIRLRNHFQLRFGKMYRRFGLFNEKLDEVPTYLGVEPPELFDGDHLILPRLTTFMIHGEGVTSGGNTWSYALSTDNGEGGPIEGVIPLGWDVRMQLQEKAIIGLSGYFSSIGNGNVVSTIDVGDGSPEGGVLPWMEEDSYTVYGGFAEVQVKNWLFKTAYWIADHDFVRNPAAVLDVINNAGINERQYENFVGDGSIAAEQLGEDDIVTSGNYKVTTGYIRVGYFINTDHGTFAPFAFIDWMNHPETVGKKTYGGDNESGIADDGKFYKWTAGVSYKPIDKVAIKLDMSQHIQKYNGETETYPEVRFDISYLFR